MSRRHFTLRVIECTSFSFFVLLKICWERRNHRRLGCRHNNTDRLCDPHSLRLPYSRQAPFNRARTCVLRFTANIDLENRALVRWRHMPSLCVRLTLLLFFILFFCRAGDLHATHDLLCRTTLYIELTHLVASTRMTQFFQRGAFDSSVLMIRDKTVQPMCHIDRCCHMPVYARAVGSLSGV